MERQKCKVSASRGGLILDIKASNGDLCLMHSPTGGLFELRLFFSFTCHCLFSLAQYSHYHSHPVTKYLTDAIREEGVSELWFQMVRAGRGQQQGQKVQLCTLQVDQGSPEQGCLRVPDGMAQWPTSTGQAAS